MLSKKLETALNQQITRELYSIYAYLSMSAFCEEQNLPGFASWLRIQSAEENTHAMKFYDYILDRGGHIVLGAIDKPPSGFASVLDAFEQAFAHEKKISGHINDLYEIAINEKDYPTQVMLQWFIEEQVEEEKIVTDIVEQLKMVGDDKRILLLLDRQLGSEGRTDAP